MIKNDRNCKFSKNTSCSKKNIVAGKKLPYVAWIHVAWANVSVTLASDKDGPRNLPGQNRVSNSCDIADIDLALVLGCSCCGVKSHFCVQPNISYAWLS